jgi:hypothetical protein
MFSSVQAEVSWIVFFPSWLLYSLVFILSVLGFLWIWVFSWSRRRKLAEVAAGLGLQFFPRVSADEMSTRGASFVYLQCTPARNCMRGTIQGRETVIFDQNMPIDPVGGRPDGPVEATVVGFRVAADSFCRDRGIVQRTFWNVEKMGEWVFVYYTGTLVKPANIASYVEEARVRFETATNPGGYKPRVTTAPVG